VNGHPFPHPPCRQHSSRERNGDGEEIPNPLRVVKRVDPSIVKRDVKEDGAKNSLHVPDQSAQLSININGHGAKKNCVHVHTQTSVPGRKISVMTAIVFIDVLSW